MNTNRAKKKKVLNRKSLFVQLLLIVLFGLVFGGVMVRVMTFDEVAALMTINIPICMLICIALMIFLWLPLFVADRQIYDITEHGIAMLSKKGMMEKWKLIFYILCNDKVEPFLRILAFDDVQSGEFSVERHAGVWGFSRYTYTLTLLTKGETVTIYINPMDNGPLMPSGKGGFVLSGYKDREEICNVITFLETKGISIGDHYHILDAFKQRDIEIYDYLESLQIKVKY